MPGLELTTLGINGPLLLLFKVMLIVGGLCYLVFAGVVMRQISVMKKTLITPLEPEIAILGWIHLGLTITLFLYFLFVL